MAGADCCQIIKAVQWEAEFKCAGISSLAEFSATISQLEEMEPVAAAIDAERTKMDMGDVPAQLAKVKVLEITLQLDALLDLMAATADGLAATADLMDLSDDGINNDPIVL